MFRARFISGLCDFTRHFNFRYSVRMTYKFGFIQLMRAFQLRRM